VVGEHDPASAHPDRRRAGSDVSDRNRGRSAGDAGHVVVLGEPKAAVAPTLGVAREVDGVGESARGVAPFDDGREIEDGERDHGGER